MIKHYKILDKDALDEIDSLISNERYEHFYLINAIKKINTGELSYCDAWSTIKNNNCWILGFWTRTTYYLFGKNWTESQVKEISKLIEFDKFNEFPFCGTFKLLEEIHSLNPSACFQDYKLRNFYRITNMSAENESASNIRLAKISDFRDLVSMRIEYYAEEYNGENNKSVYQIEPIIENEIYNNRLYSILDKNEKIVGSCSTLDDERIGIIYIKKASRQKGFGKSLLRHVTKELFVHNGNMPCHLMTDETNAGSNKLALAVGYKLIYKYSTKILNNCG